MRFRFIRSPTTSNCENVLLLFCLLSSLLSLKATPHPSMDAREIMQRSMDAAGNNALRVHEYASRKRVDEKQIDPDGSVRSEVVKTYDDVLIDGFMIRKLVAKDGKPLPEPEARKEDERVHRVLNARTHETPSEKARRLAEEQRKRTRQQEFSREVFEAFNYHLLGEELIAGRKSWLVEATPIPGYRPKEIRAQVFPHLKGKVWVDEQDYLWTKADAVAVDQISVGFGIIAKLDQGARLHFDQVRGPDGVWLLEDSGVRAIARIAIVKRIRIEEETTFDNFRKVPAGVQVVDDSNGT
jgi:hypothetical protein